MMAAWITPTRAPCTSRPAMSELRLAGAHQEAVDHAAVDVVDEVHAAPARAEQAGHDHDAGCEEVDVAAGPEARDLHDLAEQSAVEEQPHHGLHQGDEDPGRLPQQVAEVPVGHEVRIGDRVDHGFFTSASSSQNVLPA